MSCRSSGWIRSWGQAVRMISTSCRQDSSAWRLAWRHCSSLFLATTYWRMVLISWGQRRSHKVTHSREQPLLTSFYVEPCQTIHMETTTHGSGHRYYEKCVCVCVNGRSQGGKSLTLSSFFLQLSTYSFSRAWQLPSSMPGSRGTPFISQRLLLMRSAMLPHPWFFPPEFLPRKLPSLLTNDPARLTCKQ